MNVFFSVSRCLLTILWLFGALQLSESKVTCQVDPEDPKIVVLGVDSKTVSLKWETCIGDAGEDIINFIFNRQKPDNVTTQQIASRGPNDGGFTMSVPFKNFEKYRAFLEQELRIFNVQRNEKYVYKLTINYKRSDGVFEVANFQVTVVVKVPPEMTDSPAREVTLSLSSSSVQNHTMTCNASGDPHPKITWTKDGIPASQFNASGYSLHLVDVQREDAGSYTCTASNGFGDNVTATGIVSIRCPSSDCKTEKVGIRIKELAFKQPFKNQASSEFKDLESSLLSAIWAAYADNPGKQLHRVDVEEFSNGSVCAIVELAFGRSVSERLKPLRDEMKNGKLGPFTVDPQLDENPTSPPTTKSTETTTGSPGESPSTGAGTSSFPEGALWGTVAGCIVLVIVAIIIVVFICKKRRKNSGASKGSKYSEEDGYRMNRQPPPSGLGTASPAYVEARQYAPVTAARRQDDQSKPPLNYADLSFNNSSGPGRMPPPYSGTEYSEMSPEKQAKPAGGQQGEGGGFELWC